MTTCGTWLSPSAQGSDSSCWLWQEVPSVTVPSYSPSLNFLSRSVHIDFHGERADLCSLFSVPLAGSICMSFNVFLVIIYSAWMDFSGVSVAVALMAEDAEHFLCIPWLFELCLKHACSVYLLVNWLKYTLFLFLSFGILHIFCILSSARWTAGTFPFRSAGCLFILLFLLWRESLWFDEISSLNSYYYFLSNWWLFEKSLPAPVSWNIPGFKVPIL